MKKALPIEDLWAVGVWLDILLPTYRGVDMSKQILNIGDRVLGKVHTNLTRVWIGTELPTEKYCSGVIVRQMHNAMFLIKTDDSRLFACSIGYIYKPT